MAEQSPPPAGWYPVGDSERYWDGHAWTDHVRAPAAPSPGPPSAVDAHGLSHQPGQGAPFWPPPQPHSAVSVGVSQGPSGPVPVTAPIATPYGYVTPKNPGLSLLASFFVPGLGSIINGDVARGIIILVGYVVSWLLVILIVGLFGVLGFWVWGLVDAYQGARLWNARHGIVS